MMVFFPFIFILLTVISVQVCLFLMYLERSEDNIWSLVLFFYWVVGVKLKFF